MTKMAAMPIYGKNPSNIFFSETNRLINETWVKHPWLKYYNKYINHDPVMTLTKFMAWSTWVAHAFEWEKLLKCHLKGKASKKLANGQNIGINHGFQCSNIRWITRKVFEHKAAGRVFKHLSSDPANV